MTTLNSSSHNIKTARVIGVNGNIVTVQTEGAAIMKNEVAIVIVGEDRLKAEVLRIYGDVADVQVFEETNGVRYGDRVELTGELLSLNLGPGMLGVIFDGLQNPLTLLGEQDGFFLKRGREIYPLDKNRAWDFKPSVSMGDRIGSGHVLGTVAERNITHKIMAPFDLAGTVEVVSVKSGHATIEQRLVTVRDEEIGIASCRARV